MSDFHADGTNFCCLDILNRLFKGMLISRKSFKNFIEMPSGLREFEFLEALIALCTSSGLNTVKLILALVRLAKSGTIMS